MTDAPARAEARVAQPIVWRRGPVIPIASICAVVLAGVGLALSRADVVALALPFAIWCAVAMFRPGPGSVEVAVTAAQSAEGVGGSVDAAAPADWVQLVVDQGGIRRGCADVSPGDGRVRTLSRLRHSGPVDLVAVTARAVHADGAWTGAPVGPIVLRWNAAPEPVELTELPVTDRLRGLHGAHRGSRIGQGGDFRDIHPFAPGDELRRVDWRATARLARRPGDLLVRRFEALSEATVVLAIDSVDELGAVVATWGTGDPERSGTTSLDLARQAAVSLSDAALAAGDRVGLHELSTDGRTVPPGAGRRHRARMRSAIAAIGPSGDPQRYRRTPPVPPGAIVYVLSTFFDGAAGLLATRWQAVGHRVIAIDVLPVLDEARLSGEQRLALRTLRAERENVMAELHHVGVDVVSWAGGGGAGGGAGADGAGAMDAALALRVAGRRR